MRAKLIGVVVAAIAAAGTIPLHWSDNTSNCYYWQSDNVSWSLDGAFRWRTRGRVWPRECRDPSVGPVEKPRNFVQETCSAKTIFFLWNLAVTRGVQVMWAPHTERVSELVLPLPPLSPPARRCSWRVIRGARMGQGTETCADRPTEVSVIRFVSRNRTIEEIAPKKVKFTTEPSLA